MTRNRNIRSAAAVAIMSICLIAAGSFTLPHYAFAEGGDTSQTTEQSVNLGGVWVVPEVISAARQPANGGLFAWVTFDYSYTGLLSDALDPADFTLEKKSQDGNWEAVSNAKIAVLGGGEYYIASFEAIVAAVVPDNTDPFVKKWRLVYKRGTSDEIEGEVIVQAARLEETSDISVFDHDYCINYQVEQVPWTADTYLHDNIPPIYIAHVHPDSVVSIRGTGLASDGTPKIVLPWVSGIWDLKDSGVSFESEYFGMMETGLYFGDEAAAESADVAGISQLVDYWNELKESGMWPSSAEIPDKEKLYKKISETVCVPDENADEYLTSVVEGNCVFWISGTGIPERLTAGASDAILVIVRDLAAPIEIKHDFTDPEWIWTGSESDGYTGAKARFICANNRSHIQTVNATVRSRVVGEEVIYTAYASFNGKDYRNVKKTAFVEKEDLYDSIDSGSDDNPGTGNNTNSGSGSTATPAQTAVGTAQSVTLQSGVASAASVKAAIKAAGASGASEFVLGSGVTKISRNAFKGTGVKTLVIKSKKLKKKSVKGSLKGSAVKTVKVKVGNKKTNKKYVKKYKKIFTRKNAGKKVKVK